MLATHTRTVPTGDDWVHEVKWDGWRVLTHVTGGEVRLYSRSERDVTGSFPEVQGLVLPDLVLDGEIVALDSSGVPSLHALAHRLGGPGRIQGGRSSSAPVTVMLFDVLSLEGRSLLDEPWHRRRQVLEALAPELGHKHWVVPDVHDDGQLLLHVTHESGLEGIVSKRRDSRYSPGERSPAWLKRPHRGTRSVVVGGWRPETGGLDRLGALLVGVPTPDGALRFVGRVGSGLAGRAGEDLLRRLNDQAVATCPFDDVPGVDAAGAMWVRPDLVVDVESLGLAGGGRLRQPTYRGLRADLTPTDILNDIADDPAGTGRAPEAEREDEVPDA